MTNPSYFATLMDKRIIPQIDIRQFEIPLERGGPETAYCPLSRPVRSVMRRHSELRRSERSALKKSVVDLTEFFSASGSIGLSPEASLSPRSGESLVFWSGQREQLTVR